MARGKPNSLTQQPRFVILGFRRGLHKPRRRVNGRRDGFTMRPRLMDYIGQCHACISGGRSMSIASRKVIWSTAENAGMPRRHGFFARADYSE